jgi:hypothetical protein
MKIAIERVFQVLPPMRVRIVVYFIPENVILLYYGTRTTVQWNGITARNTLLTTGYSLRLAAIARLFYAPERPDPPIQVTGKIGTGIPYRIPNYFNTGNPGLWLYFSNPWCRIVGSRFSYLQSHCRTASIPYCTVVPLTENAQFFIL